MKDKLVQLLTDEWRFLRDGYVQFAQAAYTSPRFKFYCFIFVLAVSSVFYDPQILYACFLVFFGYLLGKATGPYPLFLLALILLSFLTVNPIHRLQFYFTDTNYTAYIFYLLVAPLVVWRSGRQRINGWLNYILIIPALLPLSRGAMLASLALLLYANKKYAKYFLLAGLVAAPLVYGLIFQDRSAGSDSERLYIWQQILEGNVFYAKGSQFINVYVYSPDRVENLLHLHNTPVTWLIHASHSIISTALYVALLFCVRAVSFLLLIPSFFLTVAPGPFYLLFGLSLGASNPFRRS